MAAQKAFEELIEELQATRGIGPVLRHGLGEHSLWADRKMFAHLDDDGSLVLRLAPERAGALIADGTGEAWGVADGHPLKGYLSVSAVARGRWLALAKEAHGHMLAKSKPKSNRKKASP